MARKKPAPKAAQVKPAVSVPESVKAPAPGPETVTIPVPSEMGKTESLVDVVSAIIPHDDTTPQPPYPEETAAAPDPVDEARALLEAAGTLRRTMSGLWTAPGAATREGATGARVPVHGFSDAVIERLIEAGGAQVTETLRGRPKAVRLA